MCVEARLVVIRIFGGEAFQKKGDHAALSAPLLRGLRRANRRGPVLRTLPHALLLTSVSDGALVFGWAQKGLQTPA